jgi:hypothetical protein
MSTISKAYRLVINADLPGGRNSLLKAIDDGNSISETPIWMQGDKCSIRCYFRTPGDPGEPSTSIELDAGFTMVLSGVLKDTPADSLFTVSAWTKEGEGDVYYLGALDLNTIALNAAFAANADADQLDVLVDIEIRDAGNTEWITYRAEIAIARQAYAGEMAPSPVLYPFGNLTAPDGGIWQVGVTNDGQPTFTKVDQ